MIWRAFSTVASVSNERRASTSVETYPGTIFVISAPKLTAILSWTKMKNRWKGRIIIIIIQWKGNEKFAQDIVKTNTLANHSFLTIINDRSPLPYLMALSTSEAYCSMEAAYKRKTLHRVRDNWDICGVKVVGLLSIPCKLRKGW